MIERIEIAGCASYGDDVEIMGGLAAINFVHGPSGTGKTTISRLIDDASPHSPCAVHWQRGTKLETMVYNRDFVDTNFNQSDNLKGIFTLGKKDIETQNKIIQAGREVDEFIRKIESLTLNLQGLDGHGGKRGELAEIEINFRDECWKVKTKHDEKLQGALAGYRNDRQKFKAKILAERDKASSQPPDQAELEARAASIFGPAPAVIPTIPILNQTALLTWEESDVLKKRVIGRADVDIAAMIQRLSSSDWVKQGIAYFKLSDGECPFCQQKAPDQLAASLAAYFDEAFARDTEDIASVQSGYKLEGERIQQALQAVVASAPRFLDVENLKKEKAILDSRFQLNQQLINGKVKEPSQIVTLDPLSSVIQTAARIIGEANRQIQAHNKMVANIAVEKDQLTNHVWAFLSKDELSNAFASYSSKKTNVQSAISSFEEKILAANSAKSAKQAEIRTLERSTTSIRPTVNDINRILKCFGFQNFNLQAVAGNMYRICRSDGTDAKNTLSEGERSFITFLYFFHLLRGSASESGMTQNRTVVFDDPVSSLDSDVLFIVSTLIKQVVDEVRSGTGHIKQVFVLTHNVFFYKEVTFSQKRQRNDAMKDETFWTLRKVKGVSKLKKYASNPITTSYDLLWADVRDPVRAGQSIQNTLRRILEHYFTILGGRNFEDIIGLFEGEEKLVCKGLFSWVNDGSHSVPDDVYIALDEGSTERYLDVFRKVFQKTNHISHYNMMMGQPFIIESNEEVVAG